MSAEDLQLVRRATDAYNRGDVDGFLGIWRSDAVLDWSRSRGLEATVSCGPEEIRAFMVRFLDAFDEVRIEIEDLVEVEDGVVVADNTAYVRGRDGIETQARSAWLITIEDGEQTSLTLYQTKQEALGAATAL